MIASRSFLVCDVTGSPHTFEISAETLLLDGVAATLVALDADHVTVGSSRAVVAFSYEALAQAIVGEHPTLADVGQILAHYLARWSALHQLSASLKSVQSAVGQIIIEARPWLDAPLPPYHFDELTRRALDAFDGTLATTAMLARILGQSPATIVAWAQQLGRTIPAALAVEVAGEQVPTPELAASCAPVADVPVVSSSGGKQFRWSAEMIQLLEANFLASEAASVAASMREIADRYGWPIGSMQSKLYELGIPQRKRALAAQREAESAVQEDHSCNEGQEDA